jgi:S-(hydroxymethyl)glutathione dehydrogenase/alcohol dehydrogenase
MCNVSVVHVSVVCVTCLLYTCKVENGATVAVFGCGAVGLAVIQAAKLSGASRIIAIDTNPAKFSAARALGPCVPPSSPLS